MLKAYFMLNLHVFQWEHLFCGVLPHVLLLICFIFSLIIVWLLACLYSKKIDINVKKGKIKMLCEVTGVGTLGNALSLVTLPFFGVLLLLFCVQELSL